jgi:acyl-CoA hydrolase
MHLPFPVLTAQDAAAMIERGQTVGFSAFTPAGSAKAIPRTIAERAKTEHAAGRSYQIRVLTGASTGESLDGALASANAISFRAPWQNDKTIGRPVAEFLTADMRAGCIPNAFAMHRQFLKTGDMRLNGIRPSFKPNRRNQYARVNCNAY